MDFQIIVLFIVVVSQHAVNGAAPDWAAQSGTVSVSEDAAADTVLTVSGGATELSGVPTSVEMLDTSTAGYDDAFSVALDGTTNIIFKVKAANVLDRETTSSYTINLRATNAEGNTADDGSGDLVVTVTVDDANDNAPVFTVKSLCKEYANEVAAGTSIITVVATDADAPANGLHSSAPYAFTATQTKFDIDTGSGEITVKAGETLASGGSWKLMITAKDQGDDPLHTGTGTVSVCVGTDCCASGTVLIRGTVLGLALTVLSYYL